MSEPAVDDRLPEVHVVGCQCCRESSHVGANSCAQKDARCIALRAAILAYGRSEYERGKADLLVEHPVWCRA